MSVRVRQREKTGLSKTPEYRAWIAMKARCFNEKGKFYHHYGGRGITVCVQWAHSFRAFFEYMGNRPTPNHTLDRWPNNDGNYEPGNVRWATWSQQNSNKRWTKATGRQRLPIHPRRSGCNCTTCSQARKDLGLYTPRPRINIWRLTHPLSRVR